MTALSHARSKSSPSVVQRFLTTAMLSCFALAGWLWLQESSPTRDQATAAVLKSGSAVPRPSGSGLPSISARSLVSEAQPLAGGCGPVNSTSSANDAAPAQSTAEPRYVTKNIEDIRAGDYVLAREEHGDKIALRKVVEVYRRTSYHLRHLGLLPEN